MFLEILPEIVAISFANIDELYSRWATFLGHVDAAVSLVNEDRKKADARK